MGAGVRILGGKGVVSQTDAQSKKGGAHPNDRADCNRSDERQPNQHRGHRIAGITKRNQIMGTITKGNKHNKHIAEDKQGVKGSKGVFRQSQGEVLPQVHQADAGEGKQQGNGDELLGQDKMTADFLVSSDGMGTLGPVEKSQHHKNQQGADGGGCKIHQGRLDLDPAQRLGKMGKSLESVPQEDQGKNLKLLAHRAGHRVGKTQDKADYFDSQKQVEGMLDGCEMAAGKMRSKGLGQKLPAVEFDRYDGDDEETHQHRGEEPESILALKMQFDPVKKKPARIRKKSILSVTVLWKWGYWNILFY
mgnify:CR=1 FL=1